MVHYSSTTMRAKIAWGKEHLEFEIDEADLVVGQGAPIAADLADPVHAMRDALEHPIDYPPLRLALTPDDHVAVVVDEGIPRLADLLTPILEHIAKAHVSAAAITLICPPGSVGQAWVDELPEAFEEVRVEVHQPDDRKRLAYLATTKDGRRVYLNRTAVDADQAVFLARRGYDPALGHSGAETALFPGLSDQATIRDHGERFKSRPPGEQLWPTEQEAREVAWMAGAPFFVQVIPGAADAISAIVTGPLESSAAGRALLDARWRRVFDRPADVVLASLTGSANETDLARAFFAAARVVKPGGSIAVLSKVTPTLGPAFGLLRQHEEPGEALRALLREKPADLAAGQMWARAAEHARLYLLSGMQEETAEELFVVPLQSAGQAQKLLTAGASCILLEDAHKGLAVLR